MPIPKKRRNCALSDANRQPDAYLDLIAQWTPGWHSSSRLDIKLARARALDEPILCAHLLPGLDVLLCAVAGARAPYPSVVDLRHRVLDSIAHALEQPLERMRCGGYWYEFNGLSILIFASNARDTILQDFGVWQGHDTSRTAS